MTTGFWKCLKIYETDVFEPAILLISLYVKFYSDGFIKIKITITVMINYFIYSIIIFRICIQQTRYIV